MRCMPPVPLVTTHRLSAAVLRRRDEGYLLLGGYLSGQNADGMRCRETQPIVMCYPSAGGGGGKRMQVAIVPRGSDGSSPGAAQLPPAPSDPAVSLAVAGGEVVAARQFEGSATQEACERCLQQLVAALCRDGLRLAEAEGAGYFRLAQYGPLNSLSTRINEIWLAVKL